MGAFFGAKAVADADTGWSSAALTDATGCSAHGEASAPEVCEAAVWSAVVPQRVRATGHCLQRSMRATNDRLTIPVLSSRLSQLKQVLAASKTLANQPHEGRTALGVSEDLSLAANSFCDACLSARLCPLRPRCTRSVHVRAAALRSPFYGIGERWMGSSA